ncbi:hypothetical protein AWB78_05860 [Caballeronia calidae]|uniref:Uncharacterized protein n=1 Tax=Caballeronia calidae TaxID=1777139 RepID=A0A158DZC5_9BURK|nr:hypothetical protein AWB78_05860 [Caballeronia calidae]
MESLIWDECGMSARLKKSWMLQKLQWQRRIKTLRNSASSAGRAASPSC